MAERFDVAIVGARCAGSALGRLLAQTGVRTVLVDRATFPSDTHSTHSITGHGVELLRRWGLLERVLATGVPNPRVLTARVGELELDVPYPAASGGALAPRRTVFDELLVHAADEAGATVRQGTAVEGLVHDGDRVTGLRCTGGEVLEASVVVGADGVDSRVARAVGATHYRERPSNTAGLYTYVAGTGLDHPEIALAGGHLGLVFATHDDQAVVVAGGHVDGLPALLRGGDEAFLRALDAASPRVADAVALGTRTERHRVFRPRPGRYTTSFGPGWALVGDAGHYLDPFTGQGMANAFLGAQLLADALVAGLAPGGDLAGELGRYQSRRDLLTGPVHEATHRLTRLDYDDETALGLFLDYRSAGAELAEHVAHLVDRPSQPVAG